MQTAHKLSRTPTIKDIDDWLPQTQCRKCGYTRCRGYAQAIARSEADINRCPPGGEVTIKGLAELLNIPIKPLDPKCGQHRAYTVALIDEAKCIGCTLCIPACPVDAIIGAAKQLHTVIAAECTGCELCVPPCPVDCIGLVPYSMAATSVSRWPEYPAARRATARRRAVLRLRRLARRRRQREVQHLARRTACGGQETPPVRSAQEIKAEIRAAVKRVKQKKAQRH